MRLFVYVLQGKDLPVEDSYVKLRVGKHKSKTRVLRKATNPVWNEEFVFRVHDMDEVLDIAVYQPDKDPGFFGGSGNLVGRVRIPVCSVAVGDDWSFPQTWFSLERPQNGKSFSEDCGKILLTLCLHKRGQDTSPNSVQGAWSSVGTMHPKELGSPDHIVNSKKMSEGKHLLKAIERFFIKNNEATKTDTSTEVSSESCGLSDYEECVDEPSSDSSFEEATAMIHLKSDDQELPESLQGGILLDQTYLVLSKDLNKFLFAPNSQFRKDLAERQGTTDVQEGPWIWREGVRSQLTRVVTYMTRATKLVKALKTTEEQTYMLADGREFAVLISATTPDVPYGNTFRTEMLYRITPGPVLPSGEESSHLLVSWGLNFNQNTLMKGMIEGGAKQGIRESFNQFSDLMDQNFRKLDSANILDKDRTLATLQTDQQPNWELAIKYFCNITVVSTIFMVLYVIVHILLCEPRKLQGLEFYGFDLPDSLGELITAGILVIHLEQVYYMVSHFIQARFRRGSDHGVRAQGSGWVLTVALIEGTNLASFDLTGPPDPFVVLTCNGKTRTSSVKLQTHDPQWNEILEFDATEEPPSVLDVQVFDFDGPFNHCCSLGDAEINFLKHNSTELADIWLPLQGCFAQSSQSKLHLKIFLENKKGVKAVEEYLTKMEKEVGRKLAPRSPHSNSTFQKLFALPPEEFLISDFSCYLKRRMPLQGRLFLSARIVGFYANFFMHKTKFYFLWEDIEDIQVIAPSLASVGSLVIVLREGRGFDARHGAKSQDDEGRLLFCFQSFVSFNITARTIVALWRARALTPDQKAQIVEDEQNDEGRSVQIENHEFLFDVEDVTMPKVYSAELAVTIEHLMEVFDGGSLEQKVMSTSGCLHYVATPWELVKPDVFERRVYYKFSRHISIFGGKVASLQQKSPTADGGWFVDEIMVIHNVPFADHFRVQFRYQIEHSTAVPDACTCDIFMGIKWLKSIKFQDRISKNMTDKFSHRFKDIFELAEKEILLGSQEESSMR